MANSRAENEIKIIVLGDPEVGKTQLITRFVNGNYTSIYSKTSGADHYSRETSVNNVPYSLNLVDIAERSAFGDAFYSNCDAIMLVFDVQNEQSFLNLEQYKNVVKNNNFRIPIILIGTKIDVEKRVISSERGTDKARELGCETYIETSAKDSINVQVSFRQAAEIAVAKRKSQKQEIKVDSDSIRATNKPTTSKQKSAEDTLKEITNELRKYERHLEEEKKKSLKEFFLRSIESMSEDETLQINSQRKREMSNAVKNLDANKNKTFDEQFAYLCKSCYEQLQHVDQIKSMSLDQFQQETLGNFSSTLIDTFARFIDRGLLEYNVDQKERTASIRSIKDLQLNNMTIDQKLERLCEISYDTFKKFNRKVLWKDFRRKFFENSSDLKKVEDNSSILAKDSITKELIEIVTSKDTDPSTKLNNLKEYLENNDNITKLQQLEQRRGGNPFWILIDKIKKALGFAKSKMGVTGAETLAKVSKNTHGYFGQSGKEKRKNALDMTENTLTPTRSKK